MNSRHRTRMMFSIVIALSLVAVGCAGLNRGTFPSGDPLPSWNEGAAKSRVVDFVKRVTEPGGPNFVAPAERVAVFDNDGTLWVEQPMYVQMAFVLDRVSVMAPDHPEWPTKEPFKSALAGDMQGVMAVGEAGLRELILTTHSGMTNDTFANMATAWIASARHPRFNRPYTDLVYQPMLELLDYLRSSGFKTYIVSGGGIDFLRPWAESVYGIPPEQVVGSRIKTTFEIRDSQPVLLRWPDIDFINDKSGKPVGIHQHIGRRPIAAFGNSDGDLAMLKWVAAGKGSRLSVVVHHTDAVREWAYDRESHIGRLDKGLDEARTNGWTVVDMKRDWKRVYAFETN